MVVKPIDALKKKIAELEEQKTSLEQSIENQLAEIVKLQKELERLKTVETKIMKEKQKTKEQEKAITKLETSLAETKSELDKTQNEDMKVQREKLAKAHNEIGYLNRHIRSQDKTMIELKHEVKALRSAAAGADTDLSKQLYETQVLRIEMENLRKSLPDITKNEQKHVNPSFKEYVKTKRELSQLRSENRKLRSTINRQSLREGTIIYLNDDGGDDYNEEEE